MERRYQELCVQASARTRVTSGEVATRHMWLRARGRPQLQVPQARSRMYPRLAA
jgi:hypothetical protein